MLFLIQKILVLSVIKLRVYLFIGKKSTGCVVEKAHTIVHVEIKVMS